MAQLKLIDANKAQLFSFSALDTQAAENELTARGWSHGDALKHIDAAIRAGAYAYANDAPKPNAEIVIDSRDGISDAELSGAGKILSGARKREEK